MMKKIVRGGVLSICLWCLAPTGRGQSFDAQQLILDWQKLTQLKQLLNDMYKGYEVVKNGYTTIRDISHGSFDLHRFFLDGLLAVSPWVRDYFKVAEILALQRQLMEEYKQAYARLHRDGRLSVKEIVSYSQVYSRLVGESGQTLDALLMVVTDGQLRATDGERLAQIDVLHADMRGKLSSLRRFNNEVATLSLERARDAADADEVRKLYGLHN